MIRLPGWPRRTGTGLRQRPGRAAGSASRVPLLDEGFLRQLELLSMDSLSAIMSGLAGEHPGTRRAQFGELADYRGYQLGDEPRLIDWNAYARLDELYVRTSPAEQALTVSLLIDCSRSMAMPAPSRGGAPGKLAHAKRIAAALGTVALLHSDAVLVFALGDGQARPSPAFSGRNAIGEFLRELDSVPVLGATSLPASLRSCGAHLAGQGVTVLLSDLLIPREQDEALAWLGPAGTVVHLADPEDAALPLGTVMELHDCETAHAVTVTVTAAAQQRYRQLSGARAREFAKRAAAGGVQYLRAETSQPVADLIFGTLFERGVVRSAGR